MVDGAEPQDPARHRLGRCRCAQLLAEVDRVEAWVATHVDADVELAALRHALAALRRVLAQDLEPDPGNRPHTHREGRRHRSHAVARRTRDAARPEEQAKLFNGKTRHVLKLIGADVTIAAEVLPANEPEHDAMAPLTHAAEHHRHPGRGLDRSRLPREPTRRRAARSRPRDPLQAMARAQRRALREVAASRYHTRPRPLVER